MQIALYRTLLIVLLFGVSSLSAMAAASGAVSHGLWVWKTPSVLAAPQGPEALRDFCLSEHVSEVYVSTSEIGSPSQEDQIVHLLAILHTSNIRVEALFSSIDADEPGSHRLNLLQHVQGIVRFNRNHPASRFDGIHLDIEPQQRTENKGAGNLSFLPGLVEAYAALRALADPLT